MPSTLTTELAARGVAVTQVREDLPAHRLREVGRGLALAQPAGALFCVIELSK